MAAEVLAEVGVVPPVTVFYNPTLFFVIAKHADGKFDFRLATYGNAGRFLGNRFKLNNDALRSLEGEIL